MSISWTAFAAVVEDCERWQVAHRVNARARQRLLSVRPDWQERMESARDLRTAYPYHLPFLDAKRRFQWAEAAWCVGYLSSREFLERSREFDTALLAARATDTQRNDRLDRLSIVLPEHLEQERRRLRRLDYVDRDGWARLVRHERIVKERQELWEREKQERAEIRRQRRALREGHRTLTAIRRHLAAPARSPLPA